MLDALFGGAAVAVVGAVATFLVARRGASGRIDTSTAADLWQAADQLRKEMRNEIVDLRGQATEQRSRLSAVEEAEAACRAESAILRTRLEDVTARLEEMEGRLS